MESTGTERETDNIGDCRDEYRSTFFEKPCGYQVRIRLFVGTVEQDLIISDSDAGLKVEKSTRGIDGEGVCGHTVGEMLEIQRLEILSVKKEAKLLASEVTKVEEGKGGKDLRCSNLYTVCQRR